MSAATRPIIHVTESFGGGVAAAIRDYSRNYPFAEHHLVYAPRGDAPIQSSDMDQFASVTRLGSGHIRRVGDIRRYLNDRPDAIVHAHSSFAGAYVRAAVLKSESRPILYTPHCYGFERRDSSASQRLAYWALEWIFSFNTSVFAACSKREETLSRWPLTSAKRIHIPNVASGDIRVPLNIQLQPEILRVVGAGRLGPQKDPKFFRDCVVDLRKAGYEIDAVWVGGGSPEIERMLTAASIQVTGWLSRQEVLNQLVTADVYIHSALWEGFPIAVLEASQMGVPIVARDIPAFSGLDMPLLIKSPADLVEEWASLTSTSVREDMIKQAAKALADCNDDAQADALRSLYGVEHSAATTRLARK